ncbi:hypothetical protein FVE85_7487 [Porphyridium purpureum]|uniref:Uncharacterized protein n=1 Tax=Porphyridium purpureum TaxID=35688 RepID=A0A5J4ZA44_PORPP|nr:hypothetical protein FVE85_7487 [Porphyridium purpureum]|eukprot:POR4694..scf295_1
MGGASASAAVAAGYARLARRGASAFGARASYPSWVNSRADNVYRFSLIRPMDTSVRTFAAKTKAEKTADKKAKGSGGGRGGPSDNFEKGWAALHVFKDGVVPADKLPAEKPDSEYPDWLWELETPNPSTADMELFARTLYAEGGPKAIVERMDPAMWRLLCKRKRKEAIKRYNQKQVDRFKS